MQKLTYGTSHFTLKILADNIISGGACLQTGWRAL